MVPMDSDIEKGPSETARDVIQEKESADGGEKEPEPMKPSHADASIQSPPMNGVVEQPGQQDEDENRSVAFGNTTTASLTRQTDGKKSSLHLRKLQVRLFLQPAVNDCASVVSDDSNKIEKDGLEEKSDLLRMLCLRPGYSLRTQLMLSFGTINAITVTIVVAVCIIVVVVAGENIKATNKESFQSLGRESQGRTATYLADILYQRLFPLDVVDIIVEATQDRFSGYPNDSDDEVPFLDMNSHSRKYPVFGQPMPLEWQLKPNVNEDNYEEHLQKRKFYSNRPVSTANAAFLVQGICDPSVTDPTADEFWPNCTDANNDMATGGVVAPSPTTEQIYRKGKDLVPLLKALFESREGIRDLGIYFSNSGAGASITYPHYAVNMSSSYVSAGCDWMKEANPYIESRSIGTQVMIERCHLGGESVSTRAYNPLERSWCMNQALNPSTFDATSGLDSWDDGKSLLLAIGRAVYDRLTKEFIACTYVGISITDVEEELRKAKFTNQSEVSFIGWDEFGIVLASSKPDVASGSLPVYLAGLGMTQESYEELHNLVDYGSQWDPNEVREEYEHFTVTDGEFVVSGYPIPPVPRVYDPLYQPLYLVIVSTAISEFFSVVEDVNTVVDEKVRRVSFYSIIAGVIGLGVSTLIIFFMANMLTSPLTSMNEIASAIVCNFGDPTKEQQINKGSEEKPATKEGSCTPRTELSEVVAEFNKMVSSFSGALMVKSEKGKHHEVQNVFTMQKALSELYASRGKDDFAYIIESPLEPTTNGTELDHNLSNFIHIGSNLVQSEAPSITAPTTQNEAKKSKCSPLFLWTVVLIVTPLLVVNITITAVVMGFVSIEYTEGAHAAQEFFIKFQKKSLMVHSRLRAEYVSGLTTRSTNDLYLLTRYSSWLLFGGLERSDTFSEVTTGLEECKWFIDQTQCPYVQQNSICDCAWEDKKSKTCQTYPEGSRHLQIPYFVVMSQTTLYPEHSYSPETVAYWDNATRVPGWENSASASGYDTTYDRLRVLSALPLFQVLYNYDDKKESLHQAFVAFEADGLVLGYGGCSNTLHAGSSFWKSTKENGAARIRPELCPLGKYGYDSRCRDWYDTGRKLAMQNGTSLHVTAPYRFAISQAVFAQTATSPLIDPATGEHVGQVLLDFFALPIYQVLEEHTPLSDGGFPILVAAQSDDCCDTVIGPDFSDNETAKSISKVVLPIDSTCQGIPKSECASNLAAFYEIVRSMKAGNAKNETFIRKKSGGGNETVHTAYAPVTVKRFRPINSSDFSRGVIASDYLIYSLGLAEAEVGLLGPFEQIGEDTEKHTNAALGVLSALIAAATVVVIYLSHRVTRTITESMLYLLGLIRSINRHGVDRDPSDTQRVNSSQEIAVFSETVEMLYKVVRSANSAFHAGELEVASLILVDALRLFKRLDNQKAIGIASNNLGNTMLGIYQEMKANNLDSIGGLTKSQLVTRGIAYFHEAIHLGEKAYQEFHNLHGWSPICLDFMQHLANRYFNRGLFLLTVKDDHDKPEEVKELGLRDLRIATDMDQEVISYGEDIGWACADRVEKLFHVKVVRARGYNLLLELGYPDDWKVEELLDETFEMVGTEVKRESSPLFINVSVAGRMQEIERELMKYKKVNGDLETASKIAVRMLKEDEMLFVDAQAQAVEILLEYIESAGFDYSACAKLKNALEDTHAILEDAVDEQNQMSIHDLDSDLISSSNGGLSKRRLSTRSWSLRQGSGRFVTMEDF